MVSAYKFNASLRVAYEAGVQGRGKNKSPLVKQYPTLCPRPETTDSVWK